MEWARGCWHSIHQTAVWADNKSKFNVFCNWVRYQIEHLPCQECVNHATKYLEDNPPERCEDPFIWTWRFHNSVNRRLNKVEIEYDVARQIYLEKGIKTCQSNCDQKHVEDTYKQF